MTSLSTASKLAVEIPLGTSDDTPYKERIRHEWNAVAEAWADDRWWPLVENSAQICNERLVRLAELRTGDRVLDVGTGIGEPAVTAARRVGPEGQVIGIDLAPRMIEEGRKRVRRLGLCNIELVVDDIEDLSLTPSTAFDAVLSRWVLMLMGDLGAVLIRLRGLLVPEGFLAVALWGHPERVPMISASLGAALELLRIELPPELPSPLWTHGQDSLANLAREAGFIEVRTEILETVFELPSPAAFAEFIYRMAGPVRVLVDDQPPATRLKLLNAFAEAARPFSQADGTVRFCNENILLVGRRPPRLSRRFPRVAR